MMKNNERGWTTMEMLICFPLLFAVFLMTIYFGMLLKTKLSLTNATHSAVQALAKTGDCGKAKEYFHANFDKSGATISCSSGSENSTIEATYVYAGTVLLTVPIPSTTLTSKAVSMTLFQED